jgi:hypothetical protein
VYGLPESQALVERNAANAHLLEQDRDESTVQGHEALLRDDFGEGADEAVGEGGLGDEADAGRFQGAEGNVGDELGQCSRDEVCPGVSSSSPGARDDEQMAARFSEAFSTP